MPILRGNVEISSSLRVTISLFMTIRPLEMLETVRLSDLYWPSLHSNKRSVISVTSANETEISVPKFALGY